MYATTTTTTTTPTVIHTTTTLNNRDVRIGQGGTNDPDVLDEPKPLAPDQIVDPNNALFDSFLGVNKIPSGRITIGDCIGAGGFGQVHRGNWGGHPVALKRIGYEYVDQGVIGKEQWSEDLSWEIARLSTVTHPNVV